VPVPRWTPVPRRRLYALLDEGTRGPLTLLAASAGYGKTMLLTSWALAARPPGPVAWVTVGPDDAQPASFWAHVLAALDDAGVLPGGGPPGDPGPPAASGSPLLRWLAGRLAELPRPVVLVLDDLHEAGGGAVAAELRLLLRYAPPQLRLVVATRADPPLSLHRRRVAGQLGELREADLAFTRSEARAMLGDHGVSLSGDELEALLRRTEGWAAGLRLAALTLRDHPLPGRFVDELAGDDRAIAGYLLEEVLAVQPPELRDFLLRTSVPDRLCGELADALTGRSDGAEVLARLEREHVFISATGPRRSWYRYHSLFAELLRAELRHELHGELPGLHRRAAAWHAGNGLPVEAVRHALAGGDVDQAAGLLTGSWPALLAGGNAAALRELLARLPAEQVRSIPELAAVAALSRLALGELEEADAWLGLAAAAEPGFARFPTAGTAGSAEAPEVPPPRTQVALRLARLLRARLIGDATDAEAAAAALLSPAMTTPGEPLAPDGDHRTLALALLGAAELWSGRLGEAAAHLEQAVEAAARTGREFVEVDATAHLALLEAVRGRLGRAGELARTAVERARRRGWAADTPVARAELATAVIAYHHDELAAASAALERATAAAGGDRLVQLATALLAAWLAAGGDPAERGAALARLDAAVRATGGRPPRLLAAAARAVRSQLLAVAGDDPAAEAALGEGDGVLDPMETVTLARMRLARGEPVGAMATVAPLLAGLGGGTDVPEPATAIQASLIDAVANQQLADRDAAARSLRRALELAAPEGYRRSFVEGGTPVRVLLVDHLHRDPAHRALAGGLLERLRDTAAPAPPAAPAMAAPLVEPLSEREQVVLRYLPSSLSAGEIADELYVSLNTVKTHIKSIYRKLDTNRRWDAVRRARQLQLL
jgi:LuxR family transcriptional regulator, maltose regulon positive regulatory protein